MAKVKAAGGVVWRRRDGDVEVLVVHRPRYDDWTLPKGKLDKGESFADAAVREVLEETGMACAVGPELPTSRYEVGRRQRTKKVRYWAMEAPTDARFVANREVDAAEWLPLDEARHRLSYPRDREVVDALGEALTGP